MTNGLPLIVRGAMKPLPTLTKPLRSVDTETHEPAQALRERTDSCTVPAAGVVGEAMVALVLADAYRREVRRRPHRRRARGRRRLQERIGWRSSQAPRRALVLIGFMGAGKSTVAARARAGARRARRSTATSCSSERFGHPSAQEFELHGEAGLPRAPRRQLVCELLDAAPARRAVIALGGGSVLSERVRDALEPPRRPCCSTSRPSSAWERVAARGIGGALGARWRATARRSSRCTPSAGRCTSSWPTPSCRSSRRGARQRVLRRAARARSGAGGHAAAVGAARPRASTRC